ncbi:cupin domain-containing protein [Bailinhaonella thermotolerans]|uniref:Cupin domain-containing protein n=1 Tax=Bailinhaonella thermotolerans TaxID=1070861 RepID=A0A3A4AZZ6_9ACTN|nr:cupin domain-containing protein [Bailinhaonella thermotolerans]RJL34159.1 cupin domain-containing protein [Bailinhaonella thermotolerans]
MSLILAPGEGERLRAPSGHYVVKQSGGALSVVEYHMPPGALGAAPHVHHGHEEGFWVLSGEITFDLADGPRTLARGGMVHVPRGVAHGFRNAGDTPASCLFLLSPAGYENYFRDVHRALENGEDLTPDRLAELRARYDTVSA